MNEADPNCCFLVRVDEEEQYICLLEEECAANLEEVMTTVKNGCQELLIVPNVSNDEEREVAL